MATTYSIMGIYIYEMNDSHDTWTGGKSCYYQVLTLPIMVFESRLGLFVNNVANSRSITKKGVKKRNLTDMIRNEKNGIIFKNTQIKTTKAKKRRMEDKNWNLEQVTNRKQ